MKMYKKQSTECGMMYKKLHHVSQYKILLDRELWHISKTRKPTYHGRNGRGLYASLSCSCQDQNPPWNVQGSKISIC